MGPLWTEQVVSRRRTGAVLWIHQCQRAARSNATPFFGGELKCMPEFKQKRKKKIPAGTPSLTLGLPPTHPPAIPADAKHIWLRPRVSNPLLCGNQPVGRGAMGRTDEWREGWGVLEGEVGG